VVRANRESDGTELRLTSPLEWFELSQQSINQPFFDKTTVRDSLAEILRVFGYVVATYSTADNFFQSLDAQRAGCVVVDVRMFGWLALSLIQSYRR